MLVTMILIPLIKAYDCSAYRFPYLIGGSGSSLVTNVEMDGQSIYFGGHSTQSTLLAKKYSDTVSATKSVFYSKYNAQTFMIDYTNIIDNVYV